MAMSQAALSTALTSAKTLVSSQGGALFNGLLILLTVSGEHLFRQLSFRCPCAYPLNQSVGTAFVAAPAMLLMLAGVLLNNTSWRIIHGCWYRTRRTQHGYRKTAAYWTQVLLQALVAPAAWIFVALLDGSYYECLMAGEYCRNQQPLSNKTMEQIQNEMGDVLQAAMLITDRGEVDPKCVCSLGERHELASRYLRAQSQLFAWLLLTIGVLTVAIVVVVSRACDRFTYFEYQFVEDYQHAEAATFRASSHQEAEGLARRNVVAFFSSQRTKLDWDKISVVPNSNYPAVLRAAQLLDMDQPYLSPLDQWVEEGRRARGLWRKVSSCVGSEPLRRRSLPTFDTKDVHLKPLESVPLMVFSAEKCEVEERV